MAAAVEGFTHEHVFVAVDGAYTGKDADFRNYRCAVGGAGADDFDHQPAEASSAIGSHQRKD